VELRLKKRIVGFALLVALGLIIIPLFFGHSVTSDELQLSSHIPNPPKPGNFSLNVPAKEATVPAIARDNNRQSQVVFEQVESTPAGIKNGTTPVQPMPNSVSTPAAPSLVKGSIAPTSADSATSVPPAVSGSVADNATTTIHTNTMPAPLPETTSTMVSTTSSTTVSKSSKSKTTSATNSASAQHKTKSPKAAPVAQAWSVQLGVFSDKVNAGNLMKKLQLEGFPAYIQTSKNAQGSQIKVLVGPELRRADADKLVTKLQQAGNAKGIVVKANI